MPRNKEATIIGASSGIGFYIVKIFSEKRGAIAVAGSKDINRAKTAESNKG
ncbi:MAG TPA: hypothetical protein VH796_14610 [Nitrososphaeraceae archaeon]